MKHLLKLEAITLRKKGLSYTEILKKIPIARSTLSLWLRSIGLSVKQKQRLSQKKLLSAKRGAQARYNQRITLTKTIYNNAIKDISSISGRELFLIGTTLYWAEGSKQKNHNVSQGLVFSNSDPLMVKLFLLWLNKSVKIDKDLIHFELYIHETRKDKIEDIKNYWSFHTGYSVGKFDRIYFKKDKISGNRHNKGDNYFGVLRVKVIKSTNLNRKIQGWVNGICKYCGVV